MAKLNSQPDELKTGYKSLFFKNEMDGRITEKQFDLLHRRLNNTSIGKSPDIYDANDVTGRCICHDDNEERKARGNHNDEC